MYSVLRGQNIQVIQTQNFLAIFIKRADVWWTKTTNIKLPSPHSREVKILATGGVPSEDRRHIMHASAHLNGGESTETLTEW
jgi:hypothetical protein